MDGFLKIKSVNLPCWRLVKPRWVKLAALLVIAGGVTASAALPPSAQTVGNIHLANDPLYLAFQASGAKVYASNLSGWAQINNRYLSDQELDELGRQVTNTLGIDPATLQCQPTEEPGFRGRQFDGATGRIKANVIIQTWDPQPGDISPGPETYLIVNLEQMESLELLSGGKKILNDAFRPFNTSPSINTGITGTIAGLVPEDEKRGLAQVIFAAAGAKVIESLVEPGIVSFTGYTPAIKESLLAGQNKINLNAALRYHSTDGKTYVHIASPIIMSEY